MDIYDGEMLNCDRKFAKKSSNPLAISISMAQQIFVLVDKFLRVTEKGNFYSGSASGVKYKK
jgi:hypothetical protein